MQKRLSLFFMLFMAMMILSCSTTQQQNRTPLALAQEQGIIWMSVYNNEVSDMKAVLESPTSTASQKATAEKKKEVLKKIWPWLSQYKKLVDAGSLPDTLTVAVINNLINELAALTTGGV